MRKHGKNYVEASKKVEKNKLYTYAEAVKLVKETSTTKFDGSVEVSFNLNLDTKKADQQLRGSIVLPNGTGKTKRVLVVTKSQAEEAKKAGAEFVGDDDMIAKIEKENWFDFDVIVATPDMMVSLGKIGKVLGPKGLMPNPKTGTVTNDVAKAISDIKKGMVEYRADQYGVVNTVIGRVSFKEDKIAENLVAIYNEVMKNKPTGAKGTYIKSLSISSTMGPGIKVDINSFE